MQINFDCGYLSQRYDDASKPLHGELRPKIHGGDEDRRPRRTRRRHGKLFAESAAKLPPATLADVVAQIDHAVKIGGIDHVGIGTDFDGVGCVPPELEQLRQVPRAHPRAAGKGLLRRRHQEDLRRQPAARDARRGEAGSGARKTSICTMSPIVRPCAFRIFSIIDSALSVCVFVSP
jgi:hypothetical protein